MTIAASTDTCLLEAGAGKPPEFLRRDLGHACSHAFRRPLVDWSLERQHPRRLPHPMRTPSESPPYDLCNTYDIVDILTGE